MTAVAGCLLAGGKLIGPETLVGRVAPDPRGMPAVTAPVHLDSTPSHAQVSIDGADAGWTPLEIPLSPGKHALGLATS